MDSNETAEDRKEEEQVLKLRRFPRAQILLSLQFISRFANFLSRLICSIIGRDMYSHPRLGRISKWPLSYRFHN